MDPPLLLAHAMYSPLLFGMELPYRYETLTTERAPDKTFKHLDYELLMERKMSGYLDDVCFPFETLHASRCIFSVHGGGKDANKQWEVESKQ